MESENHCKKKAEYESVPDEDFKAVHIALNIEMILEKIVNYGMRNQNETSTEKNVTNLRLVDKSWHISVSRMLAQNQEPLYKIALNKNSFLSEIEMETNNKLLDTFVATIKQRIVKPFPTIRLMMLESAFEFENYDSIYKFLLECGQGILELDLKIPRKGGSLPCIFSNLTLPVLKKMAVEFADNSLGDPADATGITGNSFNVTFLLQTLLNKNESLTELNIHFNKQWDLIPAGIQYLGLPSSLTKLTLECILRENELEILTRCMLPNLSSLKFRLSDSIYPDGLLNRILDNFKTTLKHLEILGLMYTGPPNTVNLIRFPVMEKLETLTTLSINWELESNISSIDQYFPKLEQLELLYQTESALQKWLSASPSQVQTLCLELINENVREKTLGFSTSVSLEIMQLVHKTFPNVSYLWVVMTTADVSGLEYVFMEMTQLTSLSIIVTQCDLVENSDFWDSVFLGVPTEILFGMRINQDFGKCVKFLNEDIPSIRMLTELQALHLYARTNNRQTHPVAAHKLISDLAFDFAFKRMPKLRELIFDRAFEVSDTTANAWRNEGRTLSYTF